MARYDRVIPPGGRGEIILEVDTLRIQGHFEKDATVWSNDAERMNLVLFLRGEVIPYISIEPEGYMGLLGSVGHVPPEYVYITNNQKGPLKILAIENNKPDRMRLYLEEIESGYRFRLRVEDTSREAGEYTANLIIRTDHPQRPALVIVVKGTVTGH